MPVDVAGEAADQAGELAAFLGRPAGGDDGGGFVCSWLYPVAPPRLLPGRFGIADTLRDAGPGHVESTLITTAGDHYASMPSRPVA
ncbi:MAG TPA: hypothetical protein VFW50_41980 [Streptosporangiaceae bacterium]|nr:hypothetical protein [Streptosporangiaceae bacterium]